MESICGAIPSVLTDLFCGDGVVWGRYSVMQELLGSM